MLEEEKYLDFVKSVLPEVFDTIYRDEREDEGLSLKDVIKRAAEITNSLWKEFHEGPVEAEKPERD